ncbi:NAD-dependent epimerase/dehydratase family protein [bacterium]|nr:NAD-dependent epimerase/dehydratase family protein [candidate division CSSED10-310 bacterium]
MKLMVTGATGFIGSHLCARLCIEGHEVHALVRSGDVPDVLRSTIVHHGDVTLPETLAAPMDGVDAVIHLASVLGPSGTPEDLFNLVNVKGTEHVMFAAFSRRIPWVVHCSSCGVYGSVRGAVADERTELAPEDPYERSKAAAEDVVRRYQDRGLRACVVRPAWVYGPADLRTLKLFRATARHRMVLAGPATNRQHPVYIDDLVDGFLKCITQQAAAEGKIYNLGGAEIVTIDELCTMIAAALGVKLPAVRLPLPVARLAGRMAERIWRLWGGEAPINERKVDFFIKDRAYCIDAARHDLGFAPLTRLREGFAATVAAYRKAGLLP